MTEKLCPKCGRVTDGWSLKRPDHCSPDEWVYCIKNPRPEWADATDAHRQQAIERSRQIVDEYRRSIFEAVKRKHHVVTRLEYAERDREGLVAAYGPMWTIVSARGLFVTLPYDDLPGFLEEHPGAVEVYV